MRMNWQNEDGFSLQAAEDIVVTQQVIPLGDYPVTPEVQQEARKIAKRMVRSGRFANPQAMVKEAGKEPDMNTQYDDVQDSRSYLKTQVRTVEKNAARSLEKKFGLVDDPLPTSEREMVERILAGKYRLATEEDRKNNPWARELKWRSVDEDRPGFDAAAAKLKEFTQPAWDAANVLPVDQALVQLEILRDNVKSLVGDVEPAKKSKK